MATDHRETLVPAAVLNGLDNPKVYDHDFVGYSSRREMLHGIQRAEETEAPRPLPSEQR